MNNQLDVEPYLPEVAATTMTHTVYSNVAPADDG